MKRVITLAVLVLLTITFAACAKTEKKSEPKSELNIERTSVVTSVATVEGVALKDRMVKLRSLNGNLFTVHVGKEAVNLAQVRVGDKVEVTYAQSIEVRMAEPGEIKHETTAIIGQAEPGSKPAALGVTETNVTATILALDKAKETATLKIADGAVAVVKVQNPANLDKVKVGDVIVITYLEAVGISVTGK